MAEKEKNYVSAVIYLGNQKALARPFLSALCSQLATRFAHYELVFVEDASTDGTEAEVKSFLQDLEDKPQVSMVHMSIRQGAELAMNAGLDIAIGDFVYEFDTMELSYPAETIALAYDTCLLGNDIVTVGPKRNRKVTSSLFYSLFNASNHSRHKLRTDVFHLLSRRAINRVRAISDDMPYRKAAYAASGLKMKALLYTGRRGQRGEKMRLSKAVNSLALYTNVAYKVSLAISVLMLLLMLAALVYVVVLFALRGPGGLQSGWTTTMLLLTGGFFGVFLMLAFVLKYLSLLVELVFKKQKYLVESVEKIS